MICPNCGMQIPDDSEFCQYCGSNAVGRIEQVDPCVKVDIAEHKALQKSEPAISSLAGSAKDENINSETPNIALLNKTKPKKFFATVICMSVVLAGLAGLNVYQYVVAQDNVAKITEFTEKIDELNSKLSEKDTQLKGKNSEITDLENKVSSLEDDAANYRTLIDAANYGNLGYAANNFRSSESIIVVGQNEKNRKFTLTANWSNGGTVSVDYDTYFPAAYVDFDQNSWSTSTKMTITPNFSGITVVTFSNDVNRQTFDIIIVVE